MLETISWTGSAMRLVDQTRLPTETVYVDITDHRQTWDAIKRLVVRGAPAIGVAAAFGVYIGVRHADERDSRAFLAKVDEVCDYLATARPTAVNLRWAVDRMRRVARSAGADNIKSRLLAECLEMLEEDRRVCRAIGEHGLALLLDAAKSRQQRQRDNVGILTHCNAGSLCAVQFGTALAPIYLGAERGVRFRVFSDETRPLLQGSRITASELQSAGVPVTVICDNMAAAVMRQGWVDAVIVGTDRVAANGDVANKIGTLGVAILAKHFGIPFYVAAPISSIDTSLATGEQIPIEQRDASEVTHGLGRQTAPSGVDVYNPAFDVTPAELVTAIITERGVIRAPYGESIRKIVANVE
jgi:methylthioribose-1-phosphate isomerase